MHTAIQNPFINEFGVKECWSVIVWQMVEILGAFCFYSLTSEESVKVSGVVSTPGPSLASIGQHS